MVTPGLLPKIATSSRNDRAGGFRFIARLFQNARAWTDADAAMKIGYCHRDGPRLDRRALGAGFCDHRHQRPRLT